MAPDFQEDCEPMETGYAGDGLSKMAAMKNAIEMRRPTHKELLVQRKEKLEHQLNDVNNAIQALEENPAVVEVLDKLGKVLSRL